jgi:DNA-binding NarL/FixJ family response regulator
MRIVDDKNFTKREKEIILHILSGKNKREIAKLLYLSISTIKTNIEHLYDKFSVHNKAEFIIYIVKHKIIEFEEKDYE